ncbi:MAG TPA: lysophospholipid acyltransferase family protein [Polyangiaceae bacterium]|nr:lysophospholipid acyltransferase family protein [Polyangiaceae bacterium]
MTTKPTADSEMPLSEPPEASLDPSLDASPAPDAAGAPNGTLRPRDATSLLLRTARGRVSRLEYLQMRAIRRTLEPGGLDVTLRFLQRTVGVFWITQATRHLHRVHHIERLRALMPNRSFILVSNHRSFFDLYILTATLLQWGMRQRIVFPVRSNFFYDTPAGFVVNGAMSFFAMYPPLFRDKKRAPLNALGLNELAGLLRAGNTLVGIHPEGRRNPGDDPYELLPAKSGVGRLIHAARDVAVVPVFTNGLLPNDLPRQIRSNFDGTGTKIHSVFGAPIDFSSELAEPASTRLFAKIAERCLDAVRELGHEEKALRQADGS